MLKKYNKIVALFMLALGLNVLNLQAKKIDDVKKRSLRARKHARLSLDKQQAALNDQAEDARRRAAEMAEQAQLAVQKAQEAALFAIQREEEASSEARRIAQVKESEARDAAREAEEAAKKARDQARQAADEAAQRLEAARAAAEKMNAHVEGVVNPFESPDVNQRVVKARSKKTKRARAAAGG